MDEADEATHPLDGFHINIRGVKCFDDRGSGFFHFSPITFVIGKNNSGKSTILDVIQECSKDSGPMFGGALARSGGEPSLKLECKLRVIGSRVHSLRAQVVVQFLEEITGNTQSRIFCHSDLIGFSVGIEGLE